MRLSKLLNGKSVVDQIVHHVHRSTLISILGVILYSNLYGQLVKLSPDPGDLSTIEHLEKSSYYSLRVDDEKSMVYHSDNYGSPMDARRDQPGASFATFSFAKDSVKISVTCVSIINSISIRPSAHKIIFAVDKNELNFSLKQPTKIAVVVNQDLPPLLIFADSLKNYDTTASHYFPPGIHSIGAKYTIKNGESVFIPDGSVVEGTLFIEPEAKDVRIFGNGILSGGAWSWEDFREDKDLALIRGGNAENIVIQDLTLINSPGWIIGLGGDHKTYRNLKMIAWNGNSDGPWCYGNYGTYEDCFILNNDDGLHLHNGSHWSIKNIVIWPGKWGFPIVNRTLPKFGSQSDVVINGVFIIGGEIKKPVIKFVETKAGPVKKQDIVFENIYVESYPEAPILDIEVANISLSNISLKNITMEKPMPIVVNNKGKNPISNVSIRNIIVKNDTIVNYERYPIYLTGDGIFISCE